MKGCCLFRLSENLLLPPPPSGHFYMVRYYQRIAKVQDDEPYYRSLVVVPSILFGSKYAILLQMALLPLTMCRYSITSLSDSILNRFIPLNKVYQMHAYLGYIMVSTRFLCAGDVHWTVRLSLYSWWSYVLPSVVFWNHVHWVCDCCLGPTRRDFLVPTP